MRNVLGSRATARGSGRYSPDRRWWWDDARGRWLRTMGIEHLEIVADDSRDRSWATALVSVFVPYGDVYVRFVARERGPAGLRALQSLSARPRYVGGPFPAARAGLDDIQAQGAWLDIQRARLTELQQALAEDGWEPAGRGQHWWSVRYTRLRVDPQTPPDAYDREAAEPPDAADGPGGPGRRRIRRIPEGRRRAS